MKSSCNIREAEATKIKDEDMEVLEDVDKEPAEKSEEALKKIFVQQENDERFFLLGSGLTEEEEKESNLSETGDQDVQTFNRKNSGGFKALNNEAEYEALIAGLKLAVTIEVDVVIVFYDSQLIVNQAIGEYAARDERMSTYVNKSNDQVEASNRVILDGIKKRLEAAKGK
ncbi:uncharacterized protein LOC114283321 [Camellia sinensis]|uniref:uncharacterized protein LOC114283321 n=1 Tax=Camellia sinensis TaxID=4442 RepID=UPI001035A638|nr:uncharacterized protein LOC114283321 [Camellia sinensis]